MCCATIEQIVPTLAKAKPNWKCNELFTVSKRPLCPSPNPPAGGVCASKISRML